MKCFLFFHDWEMWSKPTAIQVTPVDEVGHVLGPGSVKFRQHRKCVRCGKYQKRYV